MIEVRETADATLSRLRSERVRGLGYDLRAVYRASWTGGGASTSTGYRRVVRTVDRAPRDVQSVSPLPVIAFGDGVQTDFLLRHEAHRPISLIWAAAGAVDGSAKLLSFRQRLELVASAADEPVVQRLSALGGGLPFHLLADLTPWGVAASTPQLLDQWRRELEQVAIAETAIPDGRYLIVDGSIRQHSRDGLVGVIKSVDTVYLGDESLIPDRDGWRSPVFSLPATTTTERDVVSAYLRLHHARGSMPWSHGLVRLEARDPAVLDAACSLALQHRQSAGSGDPRWTTHLKGMRLAEDVLKAMRDPRLEF